MGNVEVVQLLGDIALLLEVDILNVSAFKVIFAIGKRLELLLHEVVDVQPGVSASLGAQ